MSKGVEMTSGELTRTDAVHVDVIGDKDGSGRARTLGSASILAILPEGHPYMATSCGTVHVNVEGGTTYIRDADTDVVLLAGRGFAATMQQLADYGNCPVVVSHDPGASSPIKNATYQPSGEFAPVETVTVTPVTSTTAESLAMLAGIDAVITEETEVPFCAEGDTFYRDRDGATGIVTNVNRYQVTLALVGGGEIVEYVKTLIEWGYEHIPAAEVRAGKHAAMAAPDPSQESVPAPVKLTPSSLTVGPLVNGRPIVHGKSAVPEARQARTFSDRDLRDQVVEYLGSDVDGFYVDGIVNTIISRHNGAVSLNTLGNAEFTEVLQQHANPSEVEVWAGTGTLIDETEADMDCCNECTWDRINRQARGTLHLVKPPIRAKLAKRSRRSVRRARRGIKGGC